MKKLVFPVIACLFFAACAPAAGRPAVRYRAQAEDVIATVAQVGVQIQPDSSFDFYSIESINDRFVTLYSENTLGAALFVGRQGSRITISASQSGEAALIASSGRGTGTDQALERIFRTLDTVYERVPGS